MERHAASWLEWLRRRLWGLWPDRNPLRRRCDRAEALILAGLVAAFVIGGPLAALAAGRWAYDSSTRAERAELSALHQVPAVLLTTATVQQAWSPATGRAWWTGPGGARRTGQVPAPAGSPAGTRVKVWVNAAGWPAEPLPRHSQIVGNAVLAAMVTVFTLALVLGGVGRLGRHLADRRRLAAWEIEWRATGPKWSRHR